ncbi:alpha kinase/elongation factor 2 kinase [Anaeramoeba flamelloides]|uniref:Alpha kinase/elongation factor 2 kinase n=1 Tax=Anaeramoeba flamelloides TaxID=1746091 RepID=A0AAV7YGB4_9EUKA|nr:alpha kinase/elongation factor 2 kinase [Anaeramoeba flamelloides]
MSSSTKFLVSIDFGSKKTGYGYCKMVTKRNTILNSDKIKTQNKFPTSILYDWDQKKSKPRSIGNESFLEYCDWLQKQEQKQKQNQNHQRDERVLTKHFFQDLKQPFYRNKQNIYSESGRKFQLEGVIIDYFTLLVQKIITTLNNEYENGEELKKKNITWILTVPTNTPSSIVFKLRKIAYKSKMILSKTNYSNLKIITDSLASTLCVINRKLKNLEKEKVKNKQNTSNVSEKQQTSNTNETNALNFGLIDFGPYAIRACQAKYHPKTKERRLQGSNIYLEKHTIQIVSDKSLSYSPVNFDDYFFNYIEMHLKIPTNTKKNTKKKNNTNNTNKHHDEKQKFQKLNQLRFTNFSEYKSIVQQWEDHKSDIRNESFRQDKFISFKIDPKWKKNNKEIITNQKDFFFYTEQKKLLDDYSSNIVHTIEKKETNQTIIIPFKLIQLWILDSFDRTFPQKQKNKFPPILKPSYGLSNNTNKDKKRKNNKKNKKNNKNKKDEYQHNNNKVLENNNNKNNNNNENDNPKKNKNKKNGNNKNPKKNKKNKKKNKKNHNQNKNKNNVKNKNNKNTHTNLNNSKISNKPSNLLYLTGDLSTIPSYVSYLMNLVPNNPKFWVYQDEETANITNLDRSTILKKVNKKKKNYVMKGAIIYGIVPDVISHQKTNLTYGIKISTNKNQKRNQKNNRNKNPNNEKKKKLSNKSKQSYFSPIIFKDNIINLQNPIKGIFQINKPLKNNLNIQLCETSNKLREKIEIIPDNKINAICEYKFKFTKNPFKYNANEKLNNLIFIQFHYFGEEKIISIKPLTKFKNYFPDKIQFSKNIIID